MPGACTGEDFALYKFLATGAPAAGRRTLPDRLDDVINVRDWGAVGDSNTNDTAAVQAAITHAIGPRTVNLPNGAGTTTVKGGLVFFPPGNYHLISPNFISVGSSDSTIAVDLVGASNGSVTIDGSISKGANTFDNIGRIEGMGVSGTVTLSGTGQRVVDVHGTIDASAAIGAYIGDCIASGGSMNSADNVAPGPPIGTIGFALGNHCVAVNCRGQLLDICYAMGGNGGALIGCAGETNRTGVRVGWLPAFALNTIGSPTSGVLLQFAALTNAVILGRYVSGTNIPANAFITAINTATNTITINNSITGLVSVVTFANETPAKGVSINNFEGERTGLAYLDLYNVNGGYFTGFAMQGAVTSEPDPPPPLITNISWSAGTATVTCQTNHNLALGQQVLQLQNAPSDWVPSYSTSSHIIVKTVTNATHFTYDLPSTPATNPLTNATSPNLGWMHAQCYGMRFRKVHNCAIIGNGSQVNAALATLDFEYNPSIINGTGINPLATPGQAEHSNNVLWGMQILYGIQMPTTNPQNKAGWSIRGAVQDTSIGAQNPLDGHAGWNGVSTVSNFNGQMNVADLPGNYSNPNGLYQLGPYEGQEYDVKNSTVAAFGNFGATVAGGGGNHVKVRYDGSAWKISG